MLFAAFQASKGEGHLADAAIVVVGIVVREGKPG